MAARLPTEPERRFDEPASRASEAAPESPPGTWTALQHRVFRLFWIFSFFAFIGASLQNVGAAWLMVDLGGSPLQVSLVQGIMSLSVVLAALPAGAVADLFDRRFIMLGSLSGLMLATAGTGALAVTGLLSPQLLLALTFLFGAASSLMTPAMQSSVPDLVSRTTLPSAVTLNGMTSSASRSVGPAFAGILISLLGAGLTLIINVLAFFGLWLVVAKLQPSSLANAPQQARPSIAAAIRGGLRFAATDNDFRRLLTRTLVLFCRRQRPAGVAAEPGGAALRACGRCGCAASGLVPELLWRGFSVGVPEYRVRLSSFQPLSARPHWDIRQRHRHARNRLRRVGGGHECRDVCRRHELGYGVDLHQYRRAADAPEATACPRIVDILDGTHDRHDGR